MSQAYIIFVSYEELKIIVKDLLDIYADFKLAFLKEVTDIKWIESTWFVSVDLLSSTNDVPSRWPSSLSTAVGCHWRGQ